MNNILVFVQSGYLTDLESVLVKNIKKSLSVILGKNETSYVDEGFALTDLGDGGSPRTLLRLRGNGSCKSSYVAVLQQGMEEWSSRHKQVDECEGCESEFAKALSVLVVLGYSCALVAVLMGAAAFARRQLLKKRVSKGPYKVLLTATDFVFPQIADSRRVS